MDDIYNTQKTYLNISIGFLYVFFLVGAANISVAQDSDPNSFKRAVINFDLEIGTLNQDVNHQLGDPVGVRTDGDGNIYVADKAALTIKVFDQNGKYLKEIGRSGRGPGEFNDIFMFDSTSEENFIIVDKSNFRYVCIDKNGEEIFSTPIEIKDSWQYYPNDIAKLEHSTVGLHVFSGPAAIVGSIYDRPLFHITDHKFEEVKASFFPFGELRGLDDTFAFVSFITKAGSFAVNSEKNQMVYSPLIYTGDLYVFNVNENQWDLEKIIQSVEPYQEPYEILNKSEYSEYRRKNIPGLKRIYYDSSDPYMGRVNSADAGVYYLDDGSIVQFRSEWADDFEAVSTGTGKLAISVQVLDTDHEVIVDKYLFSINTSSRPLRPIVNWKDKDNNFYVIDTNKKASIVKRFSLDQIIR